MPKLITHGATMCCTLGATPAKLLVTSQSFRKISGAPVATENDKTGMINIPSFGTCKCGYPNPPCVPSPQGWQCRSYLFYVADSWERLDFVVDERRDVDGDVPAVALGPPFLPEISGHFRNLANLVFQSGTAV